MEFETSTISIKTIQIVLTEGDLYESLNKEDVITPETTQQQ